MDALSSARDVHKEKIAKSQRATSSIPQGQDVTQQVSSHNQNPSSMSSSTAAYRVNEEIKDQSSSSLFELSFNGTQRVRVPSRLLREIKSPLERSSSSSDSKETPEIISTGKIPQQGWVVALTINRHSLITIISKSVLDLLLVFRYSSVKSNIIQSTLSLRTPL